MKKTSLALGLITATTSCTLLLMAACGKSQGGFNPDTIVNDGQAPVLFEAGNLLPDGGRQFPEDGGGIQGDGCAGLQCSIDLRCPGGGSTTISGVVYDPAGKNPLYNVVVYVPNTTPDPLTPGVSSDSQEACSCTALYTGQPVAAAVTDATGSFTIKDAPSGQSIPLVIQIGKWRKQIKVGPVSQCGNTAVGDITLPSKQSEGDIPSIAISTGGADSLECLLLRIGIDPSEYGAGAGGSGRIHIFQGSGAGTTAATYAPEDGGAPPSTPLSGQSLWDQQSDLTPYDITILSCEGQETMDEPANTPITTSDQQNLLNYAAAGGRVFASHYHYAWFDTGPFASANVASWTPGPNPLNEANNNPITSTNQGDWINANILTTLLDGGPFPKGQALHDWLANTKSLGTGDAPNELHINGAKYNATLSGVANSPSQEWIAADNQTVGEIDEYPGKPVSTSGAPSDAGGATQYLSFNMPFNPGLDDAGNPVYCGRVVYSDLHVGQASGDYVAAMGGGGSVPSQCADNPLSPQEKALEFMLFDLSSCVTPDTGSGMPMLPIQPK
jgi:hypothetical protein